MFCRHFIIIAMLFAVDPAWALDWSRCYSDLKAVHEKSNEAMNSTINLRILYEKHQTRKFEYDNCVRVGGDCQYLLLNVNKLLTDYKYERDRFNTIIQTMNEYLPSMKETCGYEFSYQENPLKR